MEDQTWVRQECLAAALQYFDPVLMELQLDQDEDQGYTHKFFVQIKDNHAIFYRRGTGTYEVTEEFLDPTHNPTLGIMMGTTPTERTGQPLSPHQPPDALPAILDEPSLETRALQYQAHPPLFNFSQLVVPDSLLEDLISAAETLQVEHKVFDEWGLRSIEPFPHSALNFHGPPGTGKTLAAHALAQKLGQPILSASYAEIESKFHGEGPKNIRALFAAATRDGALLFIDEADSLLSRRLLEVTQGTEQAINSMRSQLFICLQEFRGIVIFATNLIESYDKAFETRVHHFAFPLPDSQARQSIWRQHLVPQLPLADDVSLTALARDSDDCCGRDIKNAVIDAAVKAARNGDEQITLADLTGALDRIKKSRISNLSTRREMDY